ncbi:MAG: hypothetical protein GFH27_549287n224 [Chloroflexi bacterium AL-W]|nr:hypothetical protein [Chloroflexi bacterium AL-N1]NOK66498.1 hypothetical protein [Chloroflexi bacterium AL-N10]NOK71886.1 hypothetical protein [Chloroflexi bacterium AL-N5]NOK81143.1 hypothetical protein [Chloroflexi bacterium AL-W]NOK89416.1 hypothetical protein [Chloroflexi bacterium AL-N15]
MQAQKTSRAPRIFIVIMAVCVLSCVSLSGLGLGVLYLNQIFGPDPSDFNQETWLAWHNSGDPGNPRFGMYEEVEAWLLSERPTEAEVLERLGSPDAGREENMMAYNLGVPSYSIDYYSLDIYFGEDGRVSEVNLIQG